jgi:hypothetical protein
MAAMRRHEPTKSAFGGLLRQWRAHRRLSQLALAVEAEISLRHLGFLELGLSLWVRLRRQIARSRADFPQFSGMSDNRETGWWGGRDSNQRYRLLDAS